LQGGKVIFSSEFDSGNLAYAEEVINTESKNRKFELYVAPDPKNTQGLFDPET
jgi:hypothetical protein